MSSRARKSFLVAAWLVGSLLVLALGGVAIVLTTTTGARWSLAALRNFVPGELSVGSVTGSVADGVSLADVRYTSPELAATLGGLEIEAQLGALLDGRVVITRLVVENATVTLREPAAAEPAPAGEPVALPEIPQWLVVDELRARNVAVVDAAGTELAAVAELAASLAGPRIEIDTLAARAAGARVELTAQLTLADETPSRAELAWSRLAVEAFGTEWSSPSGGLTVTSGTTPIEAELAAELMGSVLPTPANVRATASLASDTLDLEELVLETLGGRFVARGTASLSALAGQASVEFAMLDPSLLDPRLEGSLDGQAVAAFAAEPALVVAAAGSLGGTLGGRPLDGTLRAWSRDGTAHIDRARIVLERSTIELAGRVSDATVEVRFDAAVPELANWYPPAAGSLRAVGSLTGPADDPSIAAELTARNVAIDASPPLEELALDVTGTLSAHRALLRAMSPYGDVDLRIEQGWNGERVAGRVLESQLELERAGDWTLTEPAEYSVAGAAVELDSLCYAGPQQARLCARVADDTLDVEATALPSALGEPWLAEGLRLDGAANLDLTLGWRPALRGSFMLTQPALRVRQVAAEDAADEPTPADFAAIDSIRISGTLTEEALAAELTAALAATADPVRASVTLTPPTGAGTLDATVSARLTSLELVDTLVADIEELAGSATIELHATGTLAEPAIEGELIVQSLSAFVPALGIEVTDGRFDARPLGLDGLELTAELCSAGCVALAGSVALARDEAPWRATAELTGAGFELANLPDLRAVIAPELMLDATPAEWRVTGSLLVEEGLLEVAAVPRSAVRPVPETVVHGRPEEEAVEELALPLVVDIVVRLGDVRFEGLGISAALGGSLDIEQTSEGQLLVNGTASIEEGTFSAYSQTLEIERGDLLFAGPPDNPSLDVRATREVEGATVGLTITGTLRNPESEIFSMPALTESEALARLVTGRSLESAGEADAEAIERAALGLGIRRALPGLGRVGQNLGLDELTVDAGSGGDESAIVAGRQLGEDIYLRYKHGLFDDFAGLELIYRISERFRLRTETGTAQSVDLLYERNRDEDAPLAETETAFDDVEPGSTPAPPVAGRAP
jgi:translocation and assembly module TamB